MATESQSSDLLVSDLRTRIADSRVVAIVGAGVSIAASGGDRIASWKGLLEDGAEGASKSSPGLPSDWGKAVKKELGSGDIDDLLDAAQKVESKLARVGELAGG